MEKFYLSVPFDEKDMAKSKGARWEPEKRKWYVPEGLDSLHFIKWIPELTPENEHNHYSENYFIGESSRRCWKCAEQIPLYAFYLPRGHKYLEFFEVDDEWEDEIPGVWNETDEGMELYDNISKTVRRWSVQPCLVPTSYLVKISVQALNKMQELTSSYRPGYSKMNGSSYYANHCPHCNRLQGDFMMYSEPGGAFLPVSGPQANRIKLHPVQAPIFLKGGSTYSTDDFFQDYTILPAQ
ncbi:DUF5710 domain-containing protein [Hafnia alvei]|uniref:DUF5710 domain-containing protein n=1 Tax=Hafnia alvei TaxID=569 RepID=UPI002DBFA8D9|nr:DUF5710 domain-containing protein [Hafnia alvei]MEB7891717.1 DUF5710 domain-containing protein [Hafnia alvei]